MAGYTIVNRDEAVDAMKQYPGFGEMRMYTPELNSDRVAFTWRQMPEGTGGRGSYGHRHPGQEEIYFVISGKATFKVGDDVFEAGPKSAVRMTGEEFYSVHNDTDADVELMLMSTRLSEPPNERQEDFWPE